VDKPTRLWNRNFSILWQAQFVSRLGRQAFSMAMVLWIMQATGSASLMGVLLAVSSLPGLVLSPIGGAVADRVSRRIIIVLSDFLSGLVTLGLGVLLLLYPQNTNAGLVGLFVASLTLGTLGGFFSPAISAAIPDIVPATRLPGANSMGQISSQVTLFIGQGLGGTVFRLIGAPFMFIFNGITFLYSATSGYFVRIPPPARREPQKLRAVLAGFRTDLAEGLRYIWRNPGLKALVLLSAASSFFATPFVVLLPFYVEGSLRAPVDWYGFILAAFGVGSLLGFVLAGVASLRGQKRATVLIVVMLLDAVFYGLLAPVRTPVLALVMATLAGLTGGFVTVNITTLLQLGTPTEMRGRVFGLLSTIAGSVTPIGTGLSGIVADLTGKRIPLIFALSALALFAISALLAANRNIRAFLATDPQPPPQAPPFLESAAPAGHEIKA